MKIQFLKTNGENITPINIKNQTGTLQNRLMISYSNFHIINGYMYEMIGSVMDHEKDILTIKLGPGFKESN